MKISVILEKKSRFNIDLSETQAELLYKDLIGSIMNSYYSQEEDIAITPVLDFKESVYSIRKAIAEESFLERIKKVAEETGKSIEKESTQKLKAGLLEVIEDTPVFRSEISKDGEVKKNLVMIKCEKCGHVATPTLFMKNRELIHKEHSLTCRECGEKLPQIRLFNHAKYNCPNCSTNANFYVANGLKEVACKECGSPIDLVWHEKRGMYISANLLERGDK